MKQGNPFAKLGALDQKLYQETTAKPQEGKSHNASIPAIQNSGNQVIQNTGKLENQNASNPVIQQTGKTKVPLNIIPTEKVTYRFHAEGKYAVEDMRALLARKHGIKASLEEIAETSILIAYEELLENQNASKLASRLSRAPENQNSS